GIGDRITDMHVRDVLDGCGDPADLSARKHVFLYFLRRAHTDLEHFIFPLAGHEADLIADCHAPLFDAHEGDDAAVRVIERIKDEGLKRRIDITAGRWDVTHDRLEHLIHVEPALG